MNPLLSDIHLAISMPGGGELLIILLIVVVVFGHNRIPQLGDALGKGIRNFRKSFAKDETEAEPTRKQVRQLDEDGAPLEQRLKAEAKDDAKIS